MPRPKSVAGSIAYRGAMARQYDAARGLSDQAAEAWRAAVLAQVPAKVSRILDLGSGTGRFSPLLARWFDAQVVAIEPAAEMRSTAIADGGQPGVAVIAGRAEAIPLANGVIDVAWLGFMIHHVVDRAACAREVARVIRRGATVLIAGAFPGRLDGINLFRFFPEAREVIEQRYPSLEQVCDEFATAGLKLMTVSRVSQLSASSYAHAANLTRRRADTTLTLISDEAFERGQHAIEQAAASEGPSPAPIIDTLDLAVFR